MNIYHIDWTYQLPLWINYTLPAMPRSGRIEIKAKSEGEALDKFQDMGYSLKKVGFSGYYRVEKVSKVGRINLYI